MRILLIFLLLSFPLIAQPVIRDSDRIVFIGDSITGHGVLAGANGWIAMIGEGIQLARPDAKPTLIGLGGSGATVEAWQSFEKRSRNESALFPLQFHPVAMAVLHRPERSGRR